MTKPFAEQYPNMHKDGIEGDECAGYGRLLGGNPYVAYGPTRGFDGTRPPSTVTLDGEFTAATLREIANFMEATRK